MIASASIRVLDMLESGDDLRLRLKQNSRYFRSAMSDLGFDLVPGSHPIIPVMLGDERLASEMAGRMMQEGIYVISFSYPVVPKGKARIRTQMSAAHDKTHLDQAIAAFAKVGKELGIIS
jgi:glycine C-acetyltransferase